MVKNAKVSHVAIIMDGNRRWAAARGLKALDGHRAGTEALAEITKHCAKVGISYLTVYALSTENIAERAKSEIGSLWALVAEGLRDRMGDLQRERIRIEILGDLGPLPIALQRLINHAYRKLKSNDRIQLNIAFNYGARAEIVRAVKEILRQKISIDEINEEFFQKNLYTAGLPDPDLIIRTGGQVRLSNFLLWQAAYSELFFTDTLWPDFSTKELDGILEDFVERKRNFGR